MCMQEEVGVVVRVLGFPAPGARFFFATTVDSGTLSSMTADGRSPVVSTKKEKSCPLTPPATCSSSVVTGSMSSAKQSSPWMMVAAFNNVSAPLSE